MSLKGKTLFITGASRGIGLATSSLVSDAPISRAPCANNTKMPAIKIKMTTS